MSAWLLLSIFTAAGVFLTACSNHSSSARHSRGTPPQRSSASVEKQLLSTVKQAESHEPGNPLLLSSLYSLARYYQDEKKFNQAAIQYQRIIELKEAQVGSNHPELAQALTRYAQILHQANRHSEAKSVTARAKSILAKSASNSSGQ